MPTFSVGGLVGRSFRIWWQNLGVFAALGALFYLPTMAAAFALGLGRMYTHPFDPDPTFMPTHAAGFFAWYVVMGALVTVHMAALTYGAIQSLGEREVRLGELLAVGLRRALPVLGAGLLAYLLFALGLVLLIVPGLILLCALAVIVPTVVIERTGPIASIKRSFQLTKGRRLAIFAAFFVLFLSFTGISLVGNLVVPIVGAKLGGAAVALAMVVTFAVNAVFGSIPTIAPAVAYHDLRAEKEGVGTADLAKVFE